MGDYRELRVWKASHAVTLEVYRVTAAFPASEMYNLTSQIRRAAASVPANLAEGAGRNTRPELARFCRIALGSANELEYHLLLARDLGYLPSAEHGAIAERVDHLKRMLARFIGKLRPAS